MLDKYRVRAGRVGFHGRPCSTARVHGEAPIWGGAWAYNPPAASRHADRQIARAAQAATLLQTITSRTMLQRLDDLSMKAKSRPDDESRRSLRLVAARHLRGLRSADYAPTEDPAQLAGVVHAPAHRAVVATRAGDAVRCAVARRVQARAGASRTCAMRWGRRSSTS